MDYTRCSAGDEHSTHRNWLRYDTKDIVFTALHGMQTRSNVR